MRTALIDRARFSDCFDMRYSILTCRRSIASSRKRKLREVFAVATDEDGIPNYDFGDPDAPAATPAEERFLTQFDIAQYVPLSRHIVFVSLRRDCVASMFDKYLIF